MTSILPKFRHVWPILLAGLALSGQAVKAAAQDVQSRAGGITVVMTDEFPPYVSSGSSGTPEGERIDMWHLWSARTGIPVTLLTRPWPEVLDTLQTGKADVVDMVAITPERRAWLDFGPSYDGADVALFYNKDSLPIRDLAGAKDHVVGVLARSQCQDNLQKAGIFTRQFGSMHDLIYSVVVGQMPVFCLQSVPAAYLLTQAGIRDDYRQSDTIFTNSLHWAVRRGDTALFQRIDEGFRLIPPSESAAIAARWTDVTTPLLGTFRTDQVLRLLEVLSAVVLAALLTAAVLRWQLGRALRARGVVEDQLRHRIREQTCLHQIFLATDDMQRPMPAVLHDIAEALQKAFPGTTPPLVRIELLGHLHDEIGARDASGALTTPILIEGKARGRITLLADPPPKPDAGGTLLLGLAASRIAGRTLGATTLAMLQKSEERFRRTFQHSAQATAVIQEGRFVNANRAALDLLGYSGDHTFLGRTPADLSPRFQPDGEPSDTKARDVIEQALEKGALRFEWEHLRSNGTPVLLEVLLTSVVEDNRTDIFVLWNDITVKRQAEAALAAYQQTLEAQVAKRTQQLTNLYDELHAIFLTATAGIALVRDGRMVTYNPSLGSILLWPQGEPIDLTTQNIFKDPAAWQASLDQAKAILASGGLFEQNVELVRLDGSTVWARLRATNVDPSDPDKGTVWVVQDISNEIAAQTQLAEARDIALQAARLKSEFLAHMSHELRSPINAVLGFTELLMGTALSEHQQEFLQKVQSSGRHLLLIINDVLDLSKVEAGKLRIEQSEFSLPSVLRSAVDTVSKGVADKNLELLVEIDPATPRRLTGDPLRISQILVNYLSNAVKFTPTGTVHLSVAPEAPASSNQATAADERLRLRFSVADSGIGMSPEQVARMFQSFSQAEDSTARLYGGTGLGLSICRQLATLMEGDVGVNSSQSGGTTFWATLPLRPAADPQPSATDTRVSGSRILLIDDHPGARAQIAADLGRSGATVISTESGPHALDTLDMLGDDPAALPDALLVDLRMPQMDGVKTIRALRARLGKRMPPTILMTKHGGQEMVDLTFAEGIDDLVIKPVDPEILTARLEQLLQSDKPRRPGIRNRARKGKAAPDAQGDHPAASGKRALVIDDNPINRELTAAMLGKQGLQVDTAENGADGLERLLDGHFDVIFMDNQMPVMGGLEATRRIRALPTAKGRIPIIGLTGRSDDADHRDGLEAGMSDYIVKPVSSAALQAVLRRWLALDQVSGTD